MSNTPFAVDIAISDEAKEIAAYIMDQCDIKPTDQFIGMMIQFAKPISDDKAVRVFVQHLLNDFEKLPMQPISWQKDFCMLCLQKNMPILFYLGCVSNGFDYSKIHEVLYDKENEVFDDYCYSYTEAEYDAYCAE